MQDCAQLTGHDSPPFDGDKDGITGSLSEKNKRPTQETLSEWRNGNLWSH